MSTLWDCGSGMTGVTFGFPIMRALFCPHLDTSKTLTETKLQETDGVKYEPESRAISFMVKSRVIFKNKGKKQSKKSDLEGFFWICFSLLINLGLHDVSCTQQQSLTQRSRRPRRVTLQPSSGRRCQCQTAIVSKFWSTTLLCCRSEKCHCLLWNRQNDCMSFNGSTCG